MIVSLRHIATRKETHALLPANLRLELRKPTKQNHFEILFVIFPFGTLPRFTVDFRSVSIDSAQGGVELCANMLCQRMDSQRRRNAYQALSQFTVGSYQDRGSTRYRRQYYRVTVIHVLPGSTAPRSLPAP